VCHEDTDEKKPHPAPLRHALSQLDVAPESTIFVGDRPEDIAMGRASGTFTVGVESEYGPRALLEEASPDCLLPDASHLPEKLGL
jgi:phosphoglycolate phosphatase-like HAD superfamily hydrolase